MNDTPEIFGAFIAIMILAGLLIFALSSSHEEQEIVDRLTEKSTEIALFNKILAAACLNNDYESRIETRKYIMDAKRLDEESVTPPLSCMDMGNSKYRIDIKDLDTNNRWTFSNYQPVTPIPMDAEFEMVVQVNANSEDPAAMLDEYHKAILTANIELDMATDKLQDEMFCDEGVPDECESGYCIKGPGQAFSTCQPGYCTYVKDVGDECATDCECETFDCTDGKCAGVKPDKLILGQPCGNENECMSGICAINNRCIDHEEFGHIIGRITDMKSGAPVEGAIVELQGVMKTAETDADGDYAIHNIEMEDPGLSQRTLTITVKSDGYEDFSNWVKVKRGQTIRFDIKITPIN